MYQHPQGDAREEQPPELPPKNSLTAHLQKERPDYCYPDQRSDKKSQVDETNLARLSATNALLEAGFTKSMTGLNNSGGRPIFRAWQSLAFHPPIHHQSPPHPCCRQPVSLMATVVTIHDQISRTFPAR